MPAWIVASSPRAHADAVPRLPFWPFQLLYEQASAASIRESQLPLRPCPVPYSTIKNIYRWYDVSFRKKKQNKTNISIQKHIKDRIPSPKSCHM